MELLDVCEDLKAKEREYYENLQKTYPRAHNNASDLGHDCERYLVHARLDWQSRAPIPVSGLRRMERGKEVALTISKLIEACGYEIIRKEEPYLWKEFKISGRLDGFLFNRGWGNHHIQIPVEIKSIAHFSFQKINQWEDLLESKWHKRYLAQMTIYFLFVEQEEGLFILFDRDSGELKLIPYHLDWELGDALLRKAERINDCVDKEIYPDRIQDFDTCDTCPFKHLCLPDMLNTSEFHFINEPELVGKLERLSEIKAAHGEYNRLWDSIKKNVPEEEGVYAVNNTWMFRVKKTKKGTRKTPINLKAQKDDDTN